jgi:hypothetical protein
MHRNISRTAVVHLTQIFNHILGSGYFSIRLEIRQGYSHSKNLTNHFLTSAPTELLVYSKHRKQTSRTNCSTQTELFYSAKLHSTSRTIWLPQRRSTVSQLARITDFITHGFNLRKHTGMVLLDIEKAYDTVRLNGLLFKLISLHLPDYLLFFLKSYLEGRTYTVHLNDTTSTPKSTPSGLPQGAILSTTLFPFYFSDKPRPPHTHLALHADDTALLSQSWRPGTISRRLSTAITTLHKYFTTWKPRLTNHKTETYYFPNAVLPSRSLISSKTPLGHWSRPSAI